MIIKEEILGTIYYFNSSNGDYSRRELDLYNYFSKNYNLYSLNFKDYNTSSMVFCINLSNACNLKCDYCFNIKKDGKSIDINIIKEYLNLCFKTYPNKDKYYVDLSGKGEPLLFLKTIIDVKNYCNEISNQIKREIVVSFVCNGTLLSSQIVDILQKNEILFGVSLDGNEFIHNLHRKTNLGDNTYILIMNNVKNISKREYLGCATTLTKDVFSLVDSIKELSEIFNTIGYKPARNCSEAFDEESIDKWLKEYEKLTIFLLNETLVGNDRYIKSLLNGEDYFGKFIKRVMLNQKCLIRCDAGLSRLTLNDDGSIYICPSSTNFEEFKIGDLNLINYSKQENIFNKQFNRNGCNNCSIKYICGGECLIEKKLSNGNNRLMCKYKKHLVLLAIYFVDNLMNKNYKEYNKLLSFCREVSNRNIMDDKFKKFLNNNPQYSFIEGRDIYNKIKE